MVLSRAIDEALDGPKSIPLRECCGRLDLELPREHQERSVLALRPNRREQPR